MFVICGWSLVAVRVRAGEPFDGGVRDEGGAVAGEAVAAEGVAARGQHLEVAAQNITVADEAEMRLPAELRRAPLLIKLLEDPRLNLSLDQKMTMQTQGILLMMTMLMEINCGYEKRLILSLLPECHHWPGPGAKGTAPPTPLPPSTGP